MDNSACSCTHTLCIWVPEGDDRLISLVDTYSGYPDAMTDSVDVAVIDEPSTVSLNL